MFFERAIVRLATKSKIFAHHFHIPLQSGSDRILRRMRRPYRASRFRELVRFIQNEIPDAGIGTDVLVGFPGETEDDFEELKEFIREFEFDYCGVFKYSREEDTKAHEMENQIPEEIKEQRMVELVNIQSEIAERKNKRFLGKTVEVMIDGVSDESEYMLEGRTRGQALQIDGKVLTNDGTAKAGEIVKVEIEQNFDYDLLGAIVKNEK